LITSYRKSDPEDQEAQMGKSFDGSDFFRMMAANEKAVAALYRQFAGVSQAGGKFFENLANDEDRHYTIYTALLTRYAGSQSLTADVSEEKGEYLNLLIENNMLKDAEKLLAKASKLSDKDEIYHLAERAERDSVLFVQELIELFPQLQPDDFRVILQEEKDHLRQVMSRRMESKLRTLRL
jgi:rubrerythrin